MIYEDRKEAGKLLADLLSEFANRSDLVVLALPRGGVPVAAEIAKRLNAPLDVFIVRKLGVPGQEELAMGAIASGGARVINDGIVKTLRITQSTIDEVAAHEQLELERRERLYRAGKSPHQLNGMQVILVDDGLATGASMRAAMRAVKTLKPAKVYVAVPVAEAETKSEFLREVDGIYCTQTPSPFRGVGQWYKDFDQTSDAEVAQLLAGADITAPYAKPQPDPSNR
ncbi:MAG: phosphoribosyltransferase [Candidatus Obscuribacterales bacterium]|nr:phosphoribosyltransferase [Cyanobacteria bacterium SZAS LIN-5]RTL41442.1 MAG: phosphoribosyltransferase [Candidatus Melainabacteria bacterium]